MLEYCLLMNYVISSPKINTKWKKKKNTKKNRTKIDENNFNGEKKEENGKEEMNIYKIINVKE